MGGLIAVAIFDQKPSASDLLELRLQAGWQPQVSALVGGDVILGHAACLVEEPKSIDGSTHTAAQQGAV